MKLGDQSVHPTPWEDPPKGPNGITIRQEFASRFMAARLLDPDEMSLRDRAAFSCLAADILLVALEKPHD